MKDLSDHPLFQIETNYLALARRCKAAILNSLVNREDLSEVSIYDEPPEALSDEPNEFEYDL